MTPPAPAADRVAAEAGARTIHYVPETPDDVGEQKALVDRGPGRPAGRRGVQPDRRPGDARGPRAGSPPRASRWRCSSTAWPAPRSPSWAPTTWRSAMRVAKALIAGLGGKGRIVALDGTPTARTARDRGEGLRQRRGRASRDRAAGRPRSAISSARRRRPRWPSCWPHIRDRRRVDRQRHDGLRRRRRAGRGRPHGRGRRHQRPARGDRQHRARRHAGHGRFQRPQHRRHRHPRRAAPSRRRAGAEGDHGARPR